MTAAPTSKLIPSSKASPCPLCGRNDAGGDCRTTPEGDFVLCHYGSSFSPPTGLRKGTTTIGHDGGAWAFLGDTADGRCAQFKPHQTKSRPHLRVISSGVTDATATAVPAALPALPDPATFFFARFLPAMVEQASWQEGEFWHYDQSHRQQRKGAGKEKRIYVHRLEEGKWLKTGSGVWPSWNENCLPLADGVPLYGEGEKVAHVLCQRGILGLSMPGHQAESIDHCTTALKRHKLAGLGVVAYLGDKGTAGKKKAAIMAAAAAAADLPFVAVDAGALWPDLPDNGSVDDLGHLEADELIAQLDQAFRDELATKLPPAGGAAGAPTREVAAPATPPAKKQKTSYLEPGEVLAQLTATIGEPRLNVRTNGVVIEGRHTSPDEVRRFYLRLSERTAADGIKWERGSTADGIVELASANAFDPVLDAVLALTSGVEPLDDDNWKRLDHLMLGVDDDVAAVFLPKYLIGAIARLFQPGAKVDQTLVLIGDQGIGKSQWGQCLFGLDPSFVVDHLGSRLDKDDITRMHRAWAVELGELDGIVRRTDQEAFKAFLTRQTDVIRRPYGASDEEMPRRTIFFGTSNGAPLKDLTGSRRFVCVGLPDKALPLQNLLEHRAALWARAIAEYKNGGQWWSNKEESEEIKAQNADFQTIDPWADVICMFLACCPNAYCTISEAFERLEVPIERRNNANTLRLRQIIEQQGWAYGQRRISGNVHRGFWKPSKPPSEDEDLF
jgi:hypothetical protein